jgi:hypothetical protein
MTMNAAAAINQIVEDATQCKFESTNNAQDEIVLLNIVQVRLPCPPARAPRCMLPCLPHSSVAPTLTMAVFPGAGPGRGVRGGRAAE